MKHARRKSRGNRRFSRGSETGRVLFVFIVFYHRMSPANRTCLAIALATEEPPETTPGGNCPRIQAGFQRRGKLPSGETHHERASKPSLKKRHSNPAILKAFRIEPATHLLQRSF